MTHLDPETLALLALGEDAASADERVHLRGCAACRQQLRDLERPVSATRRSDEPLALPGPGVWRGIAEATGLDPAAAIGPFLPGGADLADPADVVRRRRRPRRRTVAIVLAGAAAVVLLGAAVIGLRVVPPPAQLLATARLQALPGWPGNGGTAALERLPDGRRVVVVRTTIRAGADSDREVWLLTDGATRLVSLGLLHGGDGTFTVPSGVDVRRYRFVDVSDEPRDGNAAHSGDSIVRGPLRS